MKSNKLRIIIIICAIAAQLKLDAVIIHAEGFKGDPPFGVIIDSIEKSCFFFPESDDAILEVLNKKAVKNLILELSRSTKPIDVILEGEPFDTQLISQAKQNYEQANSGAKPRLWGSILLFARKNNYAIGNLRFIYSRKNRPALALLQSFLRVFIRPNKMEMLLPFIEKQQRDGTLPINEAEELRQNLSNDTTTLYDYFAHFINKGEGGAPFSNHDKILKDYSLKQQFFQKGELFDRYIKHYKALCGNVTIQKLFDELNYIQQSINQLKEQLTGTNHSQNQIIEGTEQSITALIENARDFFEKFSGHSFNEIQSMSLIDVLTNAITNHNFEEILHYLIDWYCLFSIHAFHMLTFQTILQSMNQHRTVLFIGDSTASRYILSMMHLIKWNARGKIPSSRNKLTPYQVNKMMPRIKNVLLDLPTLTCHTCGRCKLDLQKCSRCQQVHYCSRKCQKADWPQHQLVCHK